ncbi:MAG: hypothetical protein IH868_10760 [Chloroflexi bacterium]|nr:hypothetical protein [Chloroflexota bacterium]
MADETLIDTEIAALGDTLLEPFDRDRLKGATYDIRVGEAAILSSTDNKSHLRSVALGDEPLQRSVSIPPGSTCVIKSLERVHMPLDMKGRLALRAFHSRNLIFFAGGVIDPGYDDFLFLPIANLGDVPIELRYKEPLVSAEFIKMGKEAKPYQPGEKSRGEMTERRVIFDRTKLLQEVREQGEAIESLRSRLDSSEILLNASQRILDLVVLAAVAAGMIAAVVVLMPKLSFPWNAIVLGSGAGLGVIATAFLLSALIRRGSR